MFSQKVKLMINLVTAVALFILIYTSRAQIVEAFDKLSTISFGSLALLIPLQLLSYMSIAKLYHTYFRDTGHADNLHYKEMVKVSLELNFINRVLPSGGLTGFSYLSLRLRPYGVSVATSTLAQSVRFLLTFVTFLPFLAVGLFLLAASNQANGLTILIGSTIFFMIIAGGGLGLYIISDERRIKGFLAFLPRVINFIVHKLRISKQLINIKRIEAGLEEMHKLYIDLVKEYRQLKKPFMWAFVSNLFEVLTLYFVFIAFGEIINPGAIILAYVVANFAALVAVLPGGIGIYESLMSTVLTASGVARGLAISSTLVYRIINLLIFVPIGFVLYQAALSGNSVLRPFGKVKADE